MSEKLVHIIFEYRDQYCLDGKFNKTECIMRSKEECIKFYGLDQPDVEYRILLEEEVK